MIKKIKFIIFIPFILLSIQSYAQETFLLNYQDVDIAKVTQDISKFSKKTLILDPRVKGRISIFSDSILSAEQVWDVYLRTIQVHGFAALSDGGVVRIVPENEATRDSNKSLIAPPAIIPVPGAADLNITFPAPKRPTVS